jgi:hypothetical protein
MSFICSENIFKKLEINIQLIMETKLIRQKSSCVNFAHIIRHAVSILTLELPIYNKYAF